MSSSIKLRIFYKAWLGLLFLTPFSEQTFAIQSQPEEWKTTITDEPTEEEEKQEESGDQEPGTRPKEYSNEVKPKLDERSNLRETENTAQESTDEQDRKPQKKKARIDHRKVRDQEIIEEQFDDEGKLNPIPEEMEAEPNQDPKERPKNERKDMEPKKTPAKSSSRKTASSSTLELGSKIESVFLGKFPGELIRDFKQFGYDTFQSRSEKFRIPDDAPVSPDYMVGSGDQLQLNTWGATSMNRRLVIRRDGSVFVPKVGTIKIGGKSLKDATETVRARLNTAFNGLKVNLSLEQARTIQVFVVGEVKAPGTYSLVATSSLVSALVAAGGPNKNGSLRNVEVVRAGKTVSHVDLYDFLISGAAPAVPLESEDVILVPVIGKVSGIAGGVRRPAIYEIKDDTTLYDVIKLSGGLSFTGFAGRLSLERVLTNRERVTSDVLIPPNIEDLSKADAIKGELGQRVVDGDLLKVYPVLRQINKTVFLRGHIKRPGNYEFKENMKLSDLIPSFAALLPDPYTHYVQILRTVPPKDEKQSIFANLEALLSGDKTADIALNDRDEVIVFSKMELDLRERVSITGRVNKPGDYYFFQGMKLRDLIFMAGNLKRDAYLTSAEVARYSVEGDQLKVKRLQVNLNEVLSDSPKSNHSLQPRDRVFIQAIQNFAIDNTIVVQGELKYPGTYSFVPGERLSTVLKRAGGYTAQAFPAGAVFSRKTVKDLQQKSLKEQLSRLESAILQEEINPKRFQSTEDRAATQEGAASRKALLENLRRVEVTGRMVIRLTNLEDFAGGDSDVTLESHDSLMIPPIPSVVNIIGEVYNQTSLVYLPGKTVQSYLEKAGGPNQNADVSSMFLIRADGTVIARQQNRGFLLRNFYQMEVERGDTILVPKDITRFSWLSATKDITQILYQIASVTGITMLAFK